MPAAKFATEPNSCWVW